MYHKHVVPDKWNMYCIDAYVHCSIISLIQFSKMNVKSNAISFVTLKTFQVSYLLIERCIEVYEIYESFQGCFITMIIF